MIDAHLLEELRNIPSLQHITQERLQRLASVMVRRQYSQGEIIFLEGDPGAGIWFIVKGRVRIIKQSLQGRTQALCLASAGKCFGGCPLFDGDTNPATAQAVDDVTVLVLPRDQLQHLVYEDPPLVSALFQVFSSRFAHLARLSEGLGAWTVTTRINDCLLVYADWSEARPSLAVTHERLATLAGTVREVVTRHLSRLEREGVLQQEAGRIVLLKPEALHTHCLAGGSDHQTPA